MSEMGYERDQTRVAEHPGGEIQTDLYCLECGYNLRGLSGDPLRCPECGFHNPIGDVTLPSKLISAQLHRMETAPAVSVLGLLLLLPMLFVWGQLLRSGTPGGNDYGCPVFGTIMGASAWIGGIFNFRSSCLERPGWLKLLIRYQFVSLLLVALICLAFVLAERVVVWTHGSIDSSAGSRMYRMTLLMTIGLVLAGVIWGLKPLYRWLKDPMELLQRHVAVKIARDRARQDMQRGRR